MGRQPKPIEQRLEEGTYRPRVHGPIDQHVLVIGKPLDEEPPVELDAWGRDVWARLYPTVSGKTGQVTGNERDLFVMYCHAVGVVNRAMEEVKREGLFLKKKKKKRSADSILSGNDQDDEEGRTSKWERLMVRYMQISQSLARLLGLTVIDRVKIVRPKTQAEKDADQPGKLPSVRPRTALEKLNVV